MFGVVGRAGGAVGGFLKAAFARAASSVSLISPYLRGIVWNLHRDFIVLARDAYGGNSAVYACLKVLSTAVPEPPLLAYQLDAKQDKTPLPFEHPLMALIRQPNPLQTEYEFWELVTLHVGIVGRSHWWKQRGNLGQPIALWPLRPDRVSPKYFEQKKNADGTVPASGPETMQVLEGWAYWPPGQGVAQILPADDVVTFSIPDPAGESGGLVEGLGPLQVLAREAEVDNEMTAFSAALLRNSATPGVIISVKQTGLSRAEARDIKRNFQAQFGGANRGEPAVIDGDSTITQMGFSLEQMQYPSMRNFTESRVAAGFGVPPILAGLQVGLQAGIKSTTDEVKADFSDRTLSVYWRRFSDTFSLSVAAEFGPGIICRFDMNQVKALAAQLAQTAEKLSDGFVKGVVTVDEFRVEVLHLKAIGGTYGETVYMPSTVTATPTTDEYVKQSPSEIGDDAAISGLVSAQLQNGVPKSRALKTAADDVDDRDRAANEDVLRQALASVFDTVQDTIASKIRAREYVGDDDLAVAFQRLLGPALEAIFTGALLRLGASIGIEYDPAVVAVRASLWAATYTPRLISGLTQTTRALVTEAIGDYRNTPGMTIGELREILAPAFGMVRARMIAVTEVTRCYTQAMTYYQEQVANDGIAMERVVRTNNDERVCPACGPLDGKPESEWPSNRSDGPPFHVGCRCAISLRLVSAGKSLVLMDLKKKGRLTLVQ